MTTRAKTPGTRPKVKPLKDRKPRPKPQRKVEPMSEPVAEAPVVAAPEPVEQVAPPPRPNRSEQPERAVNRPVRQPMGLRNILTYPKEKMDPAYKYRWINDTGDRLEMALGASYEFVVGDSRYAGDHRAGQGGQVDSRVSKPVGGGIRAYLMRIPLELYLADQKAKSRAVDDIERAIQPTGNQYVPGGGRRAVTDT